MIELPRNAKGERPVYLGDKMSDNILAMLLALAGEVVVLRERQDTLERLMADDAGLKARIDAYRPPADVMAEREAWRAQFLDIVMRPLQQDHEAMQEKAAPKGYDSAIDIVLAAD